MPGVTSGEMPGESFPLLFHQKLGRVREKRNMPPRSAPEVWTGAALAKMAEYGVDSLLRETGWSVASSRVSLFILLVFNFSIPIFFLFAFFYFTRRKLQTSFSQRQKKQSNPVVRGIYNELVLNIDLYPVLAFFG